ncbi:MAG: hypothetical protein B7X46_14690, partial [Thiomonas sp. 15-66-11]
TGMQQINQAVAQLNAVTQQNASASEQLAATAEEMNTQANQLQQLVSTFKTGQDGDMPNRVNPSPASAKKKSAVTPHDALPALRGAGEFVKF